MMCDILLWHFYWSNLHSMTLCDAIKIIYHFESATLDYYYGIKSENGINQYQQNHPKKCKGENYTNTAKW